jgi:hypothetical protein
MAAQDNPQHVEAPAGAGPGEVGHISAFQKIAAVVYIVFCFEVGAFLLLFPWHPLWSQNFFSGFTTDWYEVWNNPFLRGAVSGLGLVNIGIAVTEAFRLRRR